MVRTVTTFFLFFIAPLPLVAAKEPISAEKPIEFAVDVAPILEQHCLHCHSENIRKGDFSLSSIDDLRDNEYVVGGDPESSHLIDLVSGESPEMPQEGEALTSEQVAILRRWVAEGVNWPETIRLYEQSKADQSWWSLQPLDEFNPAESVDHFIRARLQREGFEMNPPADRRTLIRRATYDLTGLPPTPEAVEQFVNDPDPRAYEKLIDRLLASPHYGERWGRHWLDVVRFGESNGFERNILIESLWPFRDYIIDSFNQDKPFDQLIREHLAGDVLAPGNPGVEIGSAFLVAGPYDNVGNQDADQQLQIRANTIDEMIRASGEAFLGLTIGCARCHDHKFDPIRQTDYYQLYATLAGVRHGDRVIATKEQQADRQARLSPLEQRKQKLTTQRDQLVQSIVDRAKQSESEFAAQWIRPPVERTGTEETFEAVEARYVRLLVDGTDTNPANGRGFRIDEFEIWSAGEKATNVARNAGVVASGPSRVIEDFPGAYGPQLTIDGMTGARFISTDKYLSIDLGHPVSIDRIVLSSAKGESKPDQPKFVFVSEYRIEVSLDGQTWKEVANGRDRKPVNQNHRDHRLRELATLPEQKRELASLNQQINVVDREIRSIPSLPSAWIGNHDKELAGPFHVFVGGSPLRKGVEVTAASPSFLQEVTPSYRLDNESNGATRRLEFANWIVHPENPLAPRVLANRVWHYHFGIGIVSTPNDFGYMGGEPSHPELLDWLAGLLVQEGWRLKPLHKAIMMSDTYRQSTEFQPDAAARDGGARWLWRFPPRRLSAEEIRDTMLSISGVLDKRMGGTGFRLYHYLQDNVATYVPRDEHPPETYRRAVYHQNARASRTDLMTDFDQPDCAFSNARRVETTTPLQALTVLNHSFTLDMSEAMAERIEREVGGEPVDQINRAFALCFSRPPSDEEVAQCVELMQQQGLASLCRVLLNTSELIYLL